MNWYYLMKPAAEPCRLAEISRDQEVVQLRVIQMSDRSIPDFIKAPCPMISDRVKRLFEKFIAEGLYRLCVIPGRPDIIFWEFSPRTVPRAYARFTPGGDVEAICDCGLEPFLKVEGIKKTSFLISRIVAESLLRRGYNILELKDVKTIEGTITAGQGGDSNGALW